ncbi:MAG: hypothetical protein Q9161_001992 [Pseudevernia consocians]
MTDCRYTLALELAVLAPFTQQTASKLQRILPAAVGVQVPGNYQPSGERASSVMNLILTKTRNSIGSINVDRLIYIYINQRILNRPIGPSTRKLPDTHGVTVTDEKLTEVKDITMVNEDVNDIQYLDAEDENEEL